MLQFLASRHWNRLFTLRNEAFRGVRIIVNQENINHVVPYQGGGSVSVNQVHRNEPWGVVEGHVWAVGNQVIRSVCLLTFAGVCGSTAVDAV